MFGDGHYTVRFRTFKTAIKTQQKPKNQYIIFMANELNYLALLFFE
ncbi:hypothetical protein SPHINGO8BC_50654 [Sphingobacterium multivorum]|uniref:Uncharacterized protein n=1 Tax=Sphingobacterium multivorum TaxID=28454 RepID=A0A654C5B2_SPHMU|nr:hypothetical protein SPHINGO8BC_50654 [Sphingobacterium multivorum]